MYIIYERLIILSSQYPFYAKRILDLTLSFLGMKNCCPNVLLHPTWAHQSLLKAHLGTSAGAAVTLLTHRLLKITQGMGRGIGEWTLLSSVP